MSSRPRQIAWFVGAVLLAAATWSATHAVRSNVDGSGWASEIQPTDLFRNLPPHEHAYWEWARRLGSGEDGALEAGFRVLADYPDLSRIYLRLSELCRVRHAPCEAVIAAAKPSSPRAILYRDAALAHVSQDEARWSSIAQSRHLDPALVRWIMDAMRRERRVKRIAALEAEWQQMLASDSMQAGPAFGLGYAAVLRNDWQRASLYLHRAARLAPDDAHPYRELARIAYFTGDHDGFTAALETGIESARRANDFEHEIVLRGNLGLGYLQWHGDLDRAAEMFESSLEQAVTLNMGRSIAVGGYRLANVRARQHRYEEALVLLDSAEAWYERAVPERTSELLSLRGQVLSKMYRFSDAEETIRASLQNAKRHGDDIREAQTLLALAQLSTKMGRYNQAYAAADSARVIVDAHGATDYVISAHSILGEVERLRGRYPSAERHFRIGMQNAEMTGSRTRISEISRELGITALLVGDLEAAVRHFEVAHQSGKRSRMDAADGLYLTANTYAYYKNHELAARTYRRALDTLGTPDIPLAGRIKLRLAQMKSALGDQGNAMRLLDEASHTLRRDPLQRALLDLVRGQVYLETAAFREALRAFQRAASSRTWLTSHWEVHYGTALAYWRMGDQRRAETAFRRAIADIEVKREEVPTTAGRSYFVHDRYAPYDSFAAFLEEHGRIEEAIDIGERARSRALLDLIYTTQTARGESDGDPTVQAIDAVVRSRALEEERLEMQYGDAADDARIKFVTAEKETLAQQFSRLERSLRGSHPLYTFSPISLREFQRVLRPNEAALVYRLRQEGPHSDSSSVVYVVRRNSATMVRLPSLEEFSATAPRAERPEREHPGIVDHVRLLSHSIRTSTSRIDSEWMYASRQLYDLLIEPALPSLSPEITHLHLVPSGALHYLPFAALVDGSGRYLVESFSLSLTPSLTILALCREQNPGSWKQMLILGDPDGDLPGARHEANSIAATDSSMRRVALGSEATQRLLEMEASRYDVIHLATHGRFRPRMPLASHLKLHDEDLTVDEIGRLRLNAYLVTLSACETAMSRGWHGEYAAGGEWVGMHQAFLAAGTPTVMASLWRIHDRYSGPLMGRFYSKLEEEGKAESLAEVQRGFINDARISHPYYWAGFVVIGDPL